MNSTFTDWGDSSFDGAIFLLDPAVGSFNFSNNNFSNNKADRSGIALQESSVTTSLNVANNTMVLGGGPSVGVVVNLNTGTTNLSDLNNAVSGATDCDIDPPVNGTITINGVARPAP